MKHVKITESTWSKIKDAIGNTSPSFSASNTSNYNDRQKIKVYNNTGAVVPRFGILGIGGVAVSPTVSEASFLESPILIGDLPNVTTHANGKFVICDTPLPLYGIGDAVLSGIATVKVNVTDAAHNCAQIVESTVANLASVGSSGCQIIYKDSGTGIKYAIVRIGSIGAGPQWFKIYDNTVNPMACYPATFTPPATWSDIWGDGTPTYVYAHPSITSAGLLTHYKLNSYICAAKIGDIFFALYTFPFPFPKYETIL